MNLAAHSIEVIEAAFRIANAAVIADIESEAIPVHGDASLPSGRWYDTRAMSSPHEHSSEVIDMYAEALAYALSAGLVTADPTRPYLVRINAHAQPGA